jgi:hypothetical protein
MRNETREAAVAQRLLIRLSVAWYIHNRILLFSSLKRSCRGAQVFFSVNYYFKKSKHGRLPSAKTFHTFLAAHTPPRVERNYFSPTLQRGRNVCLYVYDKQVPAAIYLK